MKAFLIAPRLPSHQSDSRPQLPAACYLVTLRTEFRACLPALGERATEHAPNLPNGDSASRTSMKGLLANGNLAKSASASSAPEPGQQDNADLEAAMLDTLTDAVLTGAQRSPHHLHLMLRVRAWSSAGFQVTSCASKIS